MWPRISPNRQAGPGRRGFTLVELVVAFSLAAFLAGASFVLLADVSSRARALSAEGILRRKAEAVLALVISDLAGGFVPPDPGTYPTFVGEDGYSGDRPASSVDFLTTSAMPFDPSSPTGDLAEVGYRLTFPPHGNGTLFRREKAPPRDPLGEGGETAAACGGITGFSLRYFDGRDWYERWDSNDAGSPWSRGKIPREVAVTLTLEGEDGRAVSLSTRVALPMAEARP